jgi:signal transduction histidine kinase
LQAKDLNQVLETILLKHRFAAQGKGITIRTNFEPLFPIKFDPNLIAKVFNNLIDNAIKYSPERTDLRIETHEVGSFVEVTIQDQGIGIPTEELPHLFGRFYRVKNQTTQKVKGTGLGLYLSKYFIEAHHGEISVHSEPGQGTTFTIRLPIHLTDSDVGQIGLTTQSTKLPNKEQYHA